MKFYALSDNVDTAMGMRLAGIEGEVLHTAEEVSEAIKTIYRYKLSQKRPLIVEVPDRHGKGDVSQMIERYVGEAIGVQL